MLPRKIMPAILMRNAPAKCILQLLCHHPTVEESPNQFETTLVLSPAVIHTPHYHNNPRQAETQSHKNMGYLALEALETLVGGSHWGTLAHLQNNCSYQ